MIRFMAAAFAFFSTAAVAIAILVLPRLPPNWIPWHTPVLDAAPTVFAHLALNHIKMNRAKCLAALESAEQLTFTRIPDRIVGTDCAYENAVRMTDMPLAFNSAPVATCALGAALYWWQRDIQHSAREHLGADVTRIEHVGTFACRNVNMERKGRRSQHATANAIDISAFVLSDGRRISLDAWARPGADANFLHAARKAACRYFNGVLSPDYNALHAGHFHLDMGPYLICR